MVVNLRIIGLVLGFLADRVLADPEVGHPVAGFGAAALSLERVTYRDSRTAGAVHSSLLIAGAMLAGATLQRGSRRFGARGSVVATATATWIVLGGTSLVRVGSTMGTLLSGGDLDSARRLLPSLCGRDPATLDADGLARATVESLAENTSDAHVAPLLWAAVVGVPGALGYRAVNTLDAMIGHRSARYLRFGWAAARLDDVANYLAARVTAMLAVACAPIVGGSPVGAVTAWRRDANRHPSPNAGVVEAAFAGALGVRLGGPTQYHYELQIRPTLGEGRTPTVADVVRAVRLSRAVQTAALAVACAGVSVAGRSGR